jgi:ferredoxin-NADP reductase
MKTLLTLTARHSETESVESFRFRPDPPFTFQCGQYLRYTLEHPDPDERGTSRFFTIASAPSEGFIQLTTRLSVPGSSFKRALQRLEEGAVLEAAGPYGQFVYPQQELPAVFIAGGIGITPFRSMLVDLANRQLDPDITLLYANSTPAIPFQRLFDDLAAKQPRLKVIYSVGQPNADWKGRVGRIDEELVQEHVPDPDKPLYYVSGPKPMVEATAKTLIDIGGRPDRIKQDFFPGYES